MELEQLPITLKNTVTINSMSKKLAKQRTLTEKQVKQLLQETFSLIKAELFAGKKVYIDTFCTMSLKNTKEGSLYVSAARKNKSKIEGVINYPASKRPICQFNQKFIQSIKQTYREHEPIILSSNR
jgi:nucleoid DNA-binding protein